MSSAMLRSMLFDVAFLGFGGAPLLCTINVHEGLASLAVGVLAVMTRSAISEAPRRFRQHGARLASAMG
jgi:hypothetical protein